MRSLHNIPSPIPELAIDCAMYLTYTGGYDIIYRLMADGETIQYRFRDQPHGRWTTISIHDQLYWATRYRVRPNTQHENQRHEILKRFIAS